MMATFGEGDPTDNAVNFMNWLNQEDLPGDAVSGVPFAVFALGNRQYPKFCEIGIRVSKRLRELGGDEILQHGEGDDDGRFVSVVCFGVSWKSLVLTLRLVALMMISLRGGPYSGWLPRPNFPSEEARPPLLPQHSSLPLISAGLLSTLLMRSYVWIFCCCFSCCCCGCC